MRSEEERERLKTTFSAVAGTYHEARPEYPQELFDAVVRHANLHPGSKVVEIGCGTGKATAVLAGRGMSIRCVELSDALAEEARRNLAGFRDVEIDTDEFESWDPNEAEESVGAEFDAIVAANSWHWIDPGIKYEKAWRLLKARGHLAFWGAGHVMPEDGDPIFVEIHKAYDEQVPIPRPGQLVDMRSEIDASGLFEVVYIQEFEWEQTYDADSYIALLGTFSNHIAMDQEKREFLFSEIRRLLAARPNGKLKHDWGAVLHIARSRKK